MTGTFSLDISSMTVRLMTWLMCLAFSVISNFARIGRIAIGGYGKPMECSRRSCYAWALVAVSFPWKDVWGSNAPSKVIFFVWATLKVQILTWIIFEKEVSLFTICAPFVIAMWSLLAIFFSIVLVLLRRTQWFYLRWCYHGCFLTHHIFLSSGIVLVWVVKRRGYGRCGFQLFGDPYDWNITIEFLIIIRSPHIKCIDEHGIGA